EEKSPDNPDKIMSALSGLQRDMLSTAKYAKTEDRTRNIDKTKGLIQRYFVKKDPPMLRHGAGLALDFENAIRRSKIESGRYECKQGFVTLSSDKRGLDTHLDQKILETICAIANIGPDGDGFIFFGVADKKEDAARIEHLDQITPIQIGNRFIVGVDRELPILKKSLDDYVKRIVGFISASELSSILKHQVVAQVDTIAYRGLSVIRLRIPAQKTVSFLGEKAYIRDDSSTVEASGKKLLAIHALFS
ncbi:MAG: helix-turn-helix domain-containing protein, partial [Castellaniella sp.]